MSTDPNPSRGARRPSSAPLYEPFDTVVVRAPLLPIEAYDNPPPATDDLVRSAIAVSSRLRRARVDMTAS